MADLNLLFSNSREEIFVKIADIVFIEADGNYINIYLANNVVHHTIRKQLNQVMDMLNEKAPFEIHHCARFGRKYIINITMVSSVNDSKGKAYFNVNGKEIGLDISKSGIKDLITLLQKEGLNPLLCVSRSTYELINMLPEVETIGEDEHVYVDLGLPSGTLWSPYNIATIGKNVLDKLFPTMRAELYGSHIAWGELKTKTNFFCEGDRSKIEFGESVNNYQFEFRCGDYSADEMREEWFFDNCEEWENYWGHNLPKDYDAAYIAMNGEDWHIPTKAQWEELISECNMQWCTSKKKTVGVLVTSKKNGNYIFFPAYGFAENRNIEGKDTQLYYWASDYDEETRSPYCCHSMHDVKNADAKFQLKTMPGSLGMLIRPVKDGKKAE